jgi:hypothetical protein
LLPSATPDLILYVTAKDIRDGAPGDCSFCPIARAFERAIKRVMKLTPDHVTVIHGLVAHVEADSTRGWTNYWWEGSAALHKFIHNVDRELPVKPGKYRVKGITTKSGSF